MIATFYTLDKKPNSTKTITNETGVNFDVTLHETTDIINPILKLKCSFSQIKDKNYVYIPTFSRFYFISDITWDLGLWLVSLKEDVLASNKTTIGASTQYVVRSASQFDGSIIDSKYTTKTGVQYSSYGAIGNKTLFGNTTDPWYIVGLIGGVVNIDPIIRPIVYNGSVVYYAMQKTQFQYLMEILLDTANFFIPTSEISDNLQKQLINPLQYIHSIRLVPFQPEVAARALYVNLGFNTFLIPSDAQVYICKMYDVTDVAHVGNGCVFENQVSIMAECHPEYTNKGEWVQSSPYTKYVLSAQPFGRFEIPSGIVTAGVIRTVDDKKYIQVDIDVLFDATTGMCTMKASVDGGGVFLYETRDMTVPVPYHQSVQDYMGFRQSNREMQNMQYNAVRGFLSAIMDFDLGEAMNVGEATKQKSMSAIDSATEANQVTVSGNGTQGSVYSFHNTLCSPTIEAYFTLFADEYNTELGRPLCQPKQINTLSGYIQCQNAAYSSASLADENRQIVAYMNGGFFYE